MFQLHALTGFFCFILITTPGVFMRKLFLLQWVDHSLLEYKREVAVFYFTFQTTNKKSGQRPNFGKNPP